MLIHLSQYSGPLQFPLLIVMGKPDCQVFEKIGSRFISLQINSLVLQGAPESLDEDVVLEAPFAVHADPDVPGFENRGKSFAGELAPLVGVENLRGAVFEQSFFERFNAEPCIQRV